MKIQRGFTLIELLVVMAVMSILVGVGVNTFNIAQKKARDTKRKADLASLAKMLEAYKLNYGVYPVAGCSSGCWDDSQSSPTIYIAGSNQNDTTFRDSYFSASLPKDPLNTGTTPWDVGEYAYAYRVESNASLYQLITRLEDENDPDACKQKQYKKVFADEIWCDPLEGGNVDANPLYAIGNGE